MKPFFKILAGIILSIGVLASFTITASAETIPVEIEYWVTPKVVHIKNDDSLKSYIRLNYKDNTNQVVLASKAKYKLNYNSDISISD